MLTFKTKKQIKDIFSILVKQNHNHIHIKELHKQFLTHTQIISDHEDRMLDDLQDNLAELEEERDDLVYKLAFLRRNMTKQLRNEFKECAYEEKMNILRDQNEIEVVCGNTKKKMKMEKIVIFENDQILDELESLLQRENSNKKKQENAYQISMRYFTDLHHNNFN